MPTLTQGLHGTMRLLLEADACPGCRARRTLWLAEVLDTGLRFRCPGCGAFHFLHVEDLARVSQQMMDRVGFRVPDYFTVIPPPIVVRDWVTWNGSRHRVPDRVPWSGWRFAAWRLWHRVIRRCGGCARAPRQTDRARADAANADVRRRLRQKGYVAE